MKRILRVVALFPRLRRSRGGAVLVLYSIDKHFFSYLPTVMSATTLAFISVVVVFV